MQISRSRARTRAQFEEDIRDTANIDGSKSAKRRRRLDNKPPLKPDGSQLNLEAARRRELHLKKFKKKTSNQEQPNQESQKFSAPCGDLLDLSIPTASETSDQETPTTNVASYSKDSTRVVANCGNLEQRLERPLKRRPIDDCEPTQSEETLQKELQKTRRKLTALERTLQKSHNEIIGLHIRLGSSYLDDHDTPGFVLHDRMFSLAFEPTQWIIGIVRRYKMVTNIETFSDTTRDLLSQVLPRLEDISKLNQILFCKAVVARAIFDVLEFRAKLPGHLAHLAPMMDKLYQENMGKPKNGGFDCMRPYSTRYNVWRRDTFRLLGTLSEESQDFYFSDVASKYTNKIDGIIRELFSLEEDKARWDRIHKMIRATVDLAFLLKTQQTQFTFYLPDFREQGQVRFNGEYMREQNGANPEEVEGEPIKLVTWPAVFCYYFHLGEMTEARRTFWPMEAFCTDP